MCASARFTRASQAFVLLILLAEALAGPSGASSHPPDSAPMEFPKNESEYPFVHNTTILEVLASQTSNDTEVDDLLHGGQLANGSLSELPLVVTEEDVAHKWDAEFIDDANKTKEMKDAARPREPYGAKLPMVQGQLAAVLAGVFVLIAVIGYAGLVYWRRFLETRLGNREMLVNEEDFCDPNDMRHFSL